MNATQEKLKDKLQKALGKAFGNEYASTDPILVPASKPEFGDYQANMALSLAKKLGCCSESCYSFCLRYVLKGQPP